MNLTYRSPKTEVRASPIHGKGLFATANIAPREIIAMKGGYIFTGPEWRTVRATLSPAEIQIADDLFMAPSNTHEIAGDMVYSNHSCEPNVAIQGQIVFIAMREADRCPARIVPSGILF
ncbi:MAG: SET domain-containing protein-lysine N-methyltransferase [Candidatus Acidiferrales bacterium]